MIQNQTRPFVSIIIPILNDYAALSETLPALERQKNYPRRQFEIIVVDNGSDDEELKKLKQLKNILLIEEKIYTGSPYSARNRGLEAAAGTVIVLLDATCTPVSNWLDKGVKCLMQNGPDIIGGKVSFSFGGKVTAAKIIDSVTSIRMKQVIEERNVAKTANLFIKREVFDKVGVFPEGIRSGGDVRWTGKATQMGLVLRYCEDAEAVKKSRSFRALLKKKWRTGKAQPKNWEDTQEHESTFRIIYHAVKPPRYSRIKNILIMANQKATFTYILKAWTVFYIMSMTHELAKIYGKLFLDSKTG